MADIKDGDVFDLDDYTAMTDLGQSVVEGIKQASEDQS
jgi:hypothetical protein